MVNQHGCHVIVCHGVMCIHSILTKIFLFWGGVISRVVYIITLFCIDWVLYCIKIKHYNFSLQKGAWLLLLKQLHLFIKKYNLSPAITRYIYATQRPYKCPFSHKTKLTCWLMRNYKQLRRISVEAMPSPRITYEHKFIFIAQ